jgi:hypothetical protein
VIKGFWIFYVASTLLVLKQAKRFSGNPKQKSLCSDRKHALVTVESGFAFIIDLKHFRDYFMWTECGNWHNSLSKFPEDSW